MPRESKPGLIHGKDFVSTYGMSERDQQVWRLMAIKGDAFEIPGAYSDSVFVPKTISDVDPNSSREMNNLKLENIQRMIEWNRKNNVRDYGVG